MNDEPPPASVHVAQDWRTARPARMNLLVPLVRSHRDSMLVPFVRTLVEDPGDRITFMHVLSPAYARAPGAIQRAAAYLSAVALPLEQDGIEVKHVVRAGEPAAEIIAVATDADADADADRDGHARPARRRLRPDT